MALMSTTNLSNTRSNISSSSPDNKFLYLNYNYYNASCLIIALSNLGMVEIIDSFYVLTKVSLERWPYFMRFVTPYPLSQAPILTTDKAILEAIKPMTSVRPSEYMAFHHT